jgi:uracil-DNA glycosylase family 4
MEDLYPRKLEALYLAGEREVLLKSKASPGKTVEGLEALRAHIGDCTRCRLSQGRTHLVFGVGNPHAELMFVGEAPGRDEDRQGEPFVGRAGKLLNKIIEAMGLRREDVYIANVVKCRPPENRNPAPDEISTCEPFLLRQIELIQPKVIVCLGTFAAQTLLQTEARIGALRSQFHAWPNAVVKKQYETALAEGSVQVMPTYHPAFLLRNPNMKKPVWEDMQKVMAALGLR